ncbi:hypothetical protein RhiirB3_417483 [Rhizophagus irregularis]|nr:hypothetical protein RhiirB3_417483 [Rhizophagus irregularis]
MDSSSLTKISPIESAVTNVLTVSNIIKVGWCKYTYSCSGDQLRSFITSTPSSEVENISRIDDPIVVNYMVLLEKGIPCTWKYKDENEKNFEILFTDKMLVRELYVFWLEDAEEHPSTLDNLTRLEGLEVTEKGTFTWEDFESSAIQFDLFIRSIKNLISRTLIGKGAVPMGELHLFPKFQQKIYECILSCKYNIHITSTNLVVKPVVRYQSLRPLAPSDFSKSEEVKLEVVKVLLAPSGIRGNLLPYRRYEADDIAAVLNEFRTLFGLDLSNLEEESSIPTLVHVQITHDNLTKDFPYPAKGVYVITDSNNIYRCEARDSGMVPEIFNNFVDYSSEQKLKPSKWWSYNDHSKEAVQILKLRNSVDLGTTSPGVDTMTPNTPGMGNGTSSASSPGHNLGTGRSSKKRPLETKAYPSPPDAIQSNEIQMPPPQNDAELTDEIMGMDVGSYEFDYYMYDDITDADFDNCDNKDSQAISPTTNDQTPGNISIVNEDSPSVGQNQISLAKHRQQQIDRDLQFEIGKVKLRYCPEDYTPLMFHNEVDMTKYMPGGKFCRATNRKKRKRGFFYTPDYEPAWVLEAKKPKTSDDDLKPSQKRNEEELEYYSSESDIDYTSESCESESESDIESNDESEVEWKNEIGNSKVSNHRELGFLNAGRLSMIFNIYVLCERRQLRRLTDCEVCNDTQSEMALQFLREQIAGGSYPFGAGIHGEGESTFEFIETRRRILENLSDDLPTSSALPSEQQEITMSLKNVIEKISVKFPRPENHPQLSVNGPLSVQDYYNLNGVQFKINEGVESNFQVLKTPDIIVCADKFLIETCPEIVKYWDKHNLTPFAGKKDVKYFVFCPEGDSLYYHVKNFFNELRVQYELHCVLGMHEPGIIQNPNYNFKQGIIPIRLKPQNRNETELDRMIRSYKSTCEEFGSSLASHIANFEKTQLVIYLINPFNHLTAYYDIFKCYAKFYTSLEKSLKSVSTKNILNYVMPQLIPIEHVVRFGENCIRPFRQRPVLKDLAFSVYTRSKSYRPLFILPKPSVVSVGFQLIKKAPPVRELIEYNKILHMSYGFSFDQRRLVMVWVDMEGKKLGSYSTPTYESKNQISLESLYKETWGRTCAFNKHIGGYKQIIITKTGVMTQEEKNLWIKVTEGKVPIFSVNLDTTLDIKPTLDGNGQSSKICGMVLNHPIPVNDFRPEATGFLVEVNNNETVSNTIQVDLLYNPKNEKKNTEIMWDVLNQFHVLSFMEVTTTHMCLPIHVLMVERCCRVYLGVPA